MYCENQTCFKLMQDVFLPRCTVGRFDLAIELMKSFAQEMSHGGQFLSSVKKALVPVKRLHGAEFDDMYCDFASPFRAYRDKEGRSGTLFNVFNWKGITSGRGGYHPKPCTITK